MPTSRPSPTAVSAATRADDAEILARAEPIRAWLLDRALRAAPLHALVDGFCDRLVAAGIPVRRVMVSGTTLDPEIEAYSFVWRRDTGGAQRETFALGSMQDEDFQRSPINWMIGEGRDEARFRVAANEGVDRFPILRTLRGEGCTDYVAFSTGFGEDGELSGDQMEGFTVSAATDMDQGFSDSDLAVLRTVRPALGAAVRIALMMMIAQSILGAYLGRDAGRRVLEGQIRRGAVETIQAVLFYADLRGFTALGDRMPGSDLVSLLDDYLSCMADPVEEEGGQVLKFLGDGLLATFDLSGGHGPDRCAAAAQAAQAALARVASFNRDRRAAGLPVMDLDVALHVGAVLYGNVGSGRRLDFTVIGPAVNEAARMEALCNDLDCHLLASRAFVDMLGRPGQFRSLGLQKLRGVRESQEVFTLAGDGQTNS
ncbi:MAG: adenylate/guanylate cyclase domain-containing protein [Inquilinaceae bacterium]